KQPSPVKPASAKPFPIPAPKPIATIPHQQSATPVQPTLSAQHPQAERTPSPQAVPRRTAPALHPTPTSPQMADILIEGLAGSSLTADLAQESRSTLTREDQPARSPRYHINPPPAYPALALKRRWQGEVWLRVLVGDQGEVIDVWVESSSGYSLLDDTAEKSVRGWKFHPAQNGTENASETVLLPIRFRLPQS
ncbi:TonB family protein, partial [Trichloromonas sp.]|uniref:energy transducer TonB n=1 Tax=Trichloromonas sp. TaxID=3069249 RepID=UPI003D81A3C0